MRANNAETAAVEWAPAARPVAHCPPVSLPCSVGLPVAPLSVWSPRPHLTLYFLILLLSCCRCLLSGFLVSVDSYMNLQLASSEEWIGGKFAGNLGEVLIRCNNVLYVRGVMEEEAMESADGGKDAQMVQA